MIHIKETIDNNVIEKIIEERKKMHCCCKENIDWISEVFEDISEQLQSSRFIECIEQLANKYPDLNLEQDILYAKEALKYYSKFQNNKRSYVKTDFEAL